MHKNIEKAYSFVAYVTYWCDEINQLYQNSIRCALSYAE